MSALWCERCIHSDIRITQNPSSNLQRVEKSIPRSSKSPWMVGCSLRQARATD
eukprot:c42830_g1_i1 orf=29-187(+)